MEPFAEIVDIWLLEDQLVSRKERRLATAIWRQLRRKKHGFTGSERTVRACISERKKEFKIGQEEQYLKLEHPKGEAQIDFGTTHVIWGCEFEEICSLTAAYSYSNGGFAVPLPGENNLSFLYSLRLNFEMSIGGLAPTFWVPFVVGKSICYGNMSPLAFVST